MKHSAVEEVKEAFLEVEANAGPLQVMVGECIQSDGWDVPWGGSKNVLFLKIILFV